MGPGSGRRSSHALEREESAGAVVAGPEQGHAATVTVYIDRDGPLTTAFLLLSRRRFKRVGPNATRGRGIGAGECRFASLLLTPTIADQSHSLPSPARFVSHASPLNPRGEQLTILSPPTVVARPSSAQWQGVAPRGVRVCAVDASVRTISARRALASGSAAPSRDGRREGELPARRMCCHRAGCKTMA